MVLITHHMDEAAQADRLIVMNDGSVIADGHAQDRIPAGGRAERGGADRAGHHRPALPSCAKLGVDVPLDALSVEECAAAISPGQFVRNTTVK